MSSDLRHLNQIAFHQPNSSVYDLDQAFPASAYVEDSNEESPTPSGTSTWHNEVDLSLLDFGDWIHSTDVNGSLLSGTGDGSHRSLGLSQDSVRYSFDMDVWSAIDNDKWPCFPG